MPLDSELILGQKKSATIWSVGSLEWIRREISGELVLLTMIGYWFRVLDGRR